MKICETFEETFCKIYINLLFNYTFFEFKHRDFDIYSTQYCCLHSHMSVFIATFHPQRTLREYESPDVIGVI